MNRAELTRLAKQVRAEQKLADAVDLLGAWYKEHHCEVVELKSEHPGKPVSARCILSGCQDFKDGPNAKSGYPMTEEGGR